MITGFKDLFSRKFFKVLLFVVLLLAMYLLLSALSALSAHSTILHFIVTLLNFYFIVFLNVGIFYFYNNNFVKIRARILRHSTIVTNFTITLKKTQIDLL